MSFGSKEESILGCYLLDQSIFNGNKIKVRLIDQKSLFIMQKEFKEIEPIKTYENKKNYFKLKKHKIFKQKNMKFIKMFQKPINR